MSKVLVLSISFVLILSFNNYPKNYGGWTSVTPMNIPRWHHASVVLPNGNILVSGGETNSSVYLTNSSEIYNIKENKWFFTDSLKVARQYGSTTSLLKNGKVLVAGGYNYIINDIYLRDVELFDPQENKWTLIDSLKVGRYGQTANYLNKSI